MYYYGYQSGYGGYPNYGCCQPICCNNGGGYGYGAAIILVLFILLVIVIGARIIN